MKRIFCILLAVVLVVALIVPAMAAEQEVSASPRYRYIQGISAGLTINKTFGLTDCTASSVVFGGDSIVLTCSLQQYNGSTWTTIKSWTSTENPSASIAKNYGVYSGYTYRVKASCSVYGSSGNLLENGYIYSDEVYY